MQTDRQQSDYAPDNSMARREHMPQLRMCKSCKHSVLLGGSSLDYCLLHTTEVPGNITCTHTASHSQQHRVKAEVADSSTKILPKAQNFGLHARRAETTTTRLGDQSAWQFAGQLQRRLSHKRSDARHMVGHVMVTAATNYHSVHFITHQSFAFY